MSTSQQFLVCDSSMLANFKSWASAISGCFSTFGWLQSSDTGQVNWSTISSVPGSGAYVYEVWEPNDSLTNFYLKVEYGNFSGTNSPCIRLTISTSTNGAGTATGLIVGPITTAGAAITPPSTTATYECDLSGAAGRFAALMWRTAGSNANQLFAIERSVNSSGAYTSSHVTLVVAGLSSFSSTSYPCAYQQSLVFGVGAAPGTDGGSRAAGSPNLMPYLAVRAPNFGTSSAFNGGIGFDTIAPYVGYFDQNLTVLGVAYASDIAEGVTFTVTLYGATRTYMPTKNSFLGSAVGPSLTALCMRYD